ncbi:MAG: hypothetical protein QM808_12300 [Steroidobacteraceae bacterium]
MKVANKLCMIAAFSLIAAAPAMAECTYPKKPSDPPKGAEAAKRGDEGLKEMIAAQKATKQFDADVKTYQSCLSTETESMISALGDKASAEDIKRVKDKQDLKFNSAYEDAQKYAEAFNVQLRAYKAK